MNTLEFFPSRRRLDYAVMVNFVATDTLRVEGFGIGDGEGRYSRKLVWRP